MSILLMIFPQLVFAANPGGVSQFEKEALSAYRSSEADLLWILGNSSFKGILEREKQLEAYIRKSLCEISCARLDWRSFRERNVCGRIPSYSPEVFEKPGPEELKEVLSFLEKARREFFSKPHAPWHSLFFLECRALVSRLLGDRLLWEAQKSYLSELRKANQEKDLEKAILSLYRLRRFKEVVLLASELDRLKDLEPDRKIALLRAVRSSLVFAGSPRSALVAEISASLRRLGDKGEEVGRVLLQDLGFLVGSRLELARVAGVLGEVANRWNLTGRKAALVCTFAALASVAAGDYSFALPLLQKALSQEKEGYLASLCHGTLGICFEGLGRYEEAASYFEHAWKLAERNGLNDYAIKQVINCAASLTALNQYDRALRILRSVLEKISDAKAEVWVRLSLAVVKYLQATKDSPEGPLSPKERGLLSDSKFILERTAQRLNEEADFPQKDYLRTLVLINLGNVYRREALAEKGKKRYELLSEALFFARKALDLARKGKYDRLSVIAGSNLSELLIDQGKFREAKAFASWAVKAAKAISYFEAAWRANAYLGRIAEKEGDFEEAEKFYWEAVRIIESYRKRQFTDAFKASFLDNKVRAYRDLARVLLRRGKVKEAFEVAERAKARTALETLGLKELLGTLGRKSSIAKKVAMILEKIVALRADFGEPILNSISSAAKPHSLHSLQKELSKLLEKVKLSETERPAVRYLLGDVAKTESVQRSLREDEVLLEYFCIGRALARWTIRREGVRADILPGRWVEVVKLADEFWKSRAGSDLLAEKLGSILFSGFSSLPEKLLIVPTSNLYKLPFEALKFGGKRVLEISETRYLPSAGLILLKKKSLPSKDLFVAFADPFTDYDGDGRPDKPPLPFARKEVERLSSYWPKVIKEVGSEATEERFYSLSEKGGLIHVACHGVFHPLNPWRSKLFFAPGASYDGLVEAWEVLKLDLQDTSVVTLSGCETGVLSDLEGDEVVGLPRSFLLAGTDSIVASLWPVEDKATSVMMNFFYGELAKGQSVPAALRSAKLRLMAHPDLGKPSNWAAFVVFGSAVKVEAARADKFNRTLPKRISPSQKVSR